MGGAPSPAPTGRAGPRSGGRVAGVTEQRRPCGGAGEARRGPARPLIRTHLDTSSADTPESVLAKVDNALFRA
ncbi:hypothetical protein CP967_07495 [Streptomyces nitrosporeus]|uniref:Uncharacterized protein n=1 Tax=Streptomyces nitrosporeus TaxID=28894 RepID=A0A5J6FA88_9ACTN|nr:hypothetical protein CP967_07495 [Streptomyces nitrosporeus]